jgi:hypothetical protein
VADAVKVNRNLVKKVVQRLLDEVAEELVFRQF